MLAKRAADGALREHRDFLAGLCEAPCGPELGGLRAGVLAPSPISMFMPARARRELEKALELSVGGRSGEGVARGEPPPGHYVSKRAVTGRDVGFLEAQARYARAGPELDAQLELAARALARGEGVSEQARRLFHSGAWREAEAAFAAALAHLEPALAATVRPPLTAREMAALQLRAKLMAIATLASAAQCRRARGRGVPPER